MDDFFIGECIGTYRRTFGELAFIASTKFLATTTHYVFVDVIIGLHLKYKK